MASLFNKSLPRKRVVIEIAFRECLRGDNTPGQRPAIAMARNPFRPAACQVFLGWNPAMARFPHPPVGEGLINQNSLISWAGGSAGVPLDSLESVVVLSFHVEKLTTVQVHNNNGIS